MSATELVIERREIEQALSGLLDRVFGDASAIELSNEYYWAIVPSEEAYGVDSAPEPTVGQLSFDVERIREIAADPDRSIGYALAFLAPVLSAIAVERPW